MAIGAGQLLTVIGDLGVDLVLGPLSSWPRIGTETLMERSELRAGGQAGNAALAASYLGGAARLISLVGHDEIGAWLKQQFRHLDAPLPICAAPTTLSVALIHSSGERTFFTTRGHLEALSYEMVERQLTPAPYAHSIALLSGVFLTPALRRDYLRLIRELQRRGYEVALDTNWPPEDWNSALRAEMAGWIAECEHVLLNELEVVSLADTPDLALAIERLRPLLKPGATLAIKVGPRGAVGVRDGERVECAAPQATIFDTIGAGDAFNAGYLLGRLAGCALGEALASGCRAAAAIISRFPRGSLAPGELAAALARAVPVAEGAI